MRQRGYAWALLLAVLSEWHPSPAAWGGPPFRTDDPVPVAPQRWELYGGLQWSLGPQESSETAPSIEVVHGVLGGLELSMSLSTALALGQRERPQYGLGDVQLGGKLRFVEETRLRPQVAVAPALVLPTGAAARGLRAGAFQASLPLWLQKEHGPWTAYGGGGLQLSSDRSHALSFGWVLQRSLSPRLALGAEAFFTMPLRPEPKQVELNLGATIDLTARHHLLFSAGPALGGGAQVQAYAAYVLSL